jgi:maspardin
MTNALIASRDGFAAAHAEERVTLNGREWGVVELAGDGPCLLLIPGTLGRADIFWQQMAALKGRARILSVSYPDSGGVAEWADDLVALLDARGIDQATVLGSSLGGYLAQYIGAVHPARVARLIAANTLYDTAPAKKSPPYVSDLDAAPIEELRAGFGRGLNAWADSHPDQREMIELLLAEVGGRIPEAELRSRLKGIKNAPPLPPVKIPADNIVTIEGVDDPLIPPFMREEVREALKPAVSYRFESGGHFPYTVRPEHYTAILEEQLGLVPAGSTVWGSEGTRAL